MSLIEIGTSAGLQLLWDKYAYSYNISDKTYGDVNSPVRIASEIRGDKTPPFLDVIPPVASRLGIDLHLNDLRDPEDRLWLKALIWPEHDDRRELFERAADCFKNHPVELVEADGVTHLPLVAERIPQDTAICIFHTHVANQMPPQTKHALLRTVRELGKTRDVFHLYNNIRDLNLLHLDSCIDGHEHSETLAATDGHGRWFKWLQ